MTTTEIKKYAQEFREGLFKDRKGDGLCFAISSPLCGALSFLGVNCRVAHFQVESFNKFDEHYAILIDESTLLDPTFDQINEGNEKVYLGECPETYIEI